MTITLKGKAEEFVQQQIQSGHFRSPDEVVEAAIGCMIVESDLQALAQASLAMAPQILAPEDFSDWER